MINPTLIILYVAMMFGRWTRTRSQRWSRVSAFARRGMESPIKAMIWGGPGRGLFSTLWGLSASQLLGRRSREMMNSTSGSEHFP